MIKESRISYRAIIFALLIISISALVFRVFLIAQSDFLRQHLYLSVHGFLGEILLPLSIAAITIFLNRNYFYKLGLIIIFANNLLINADFFHFYCYGFRLNTLLLSQKRWLEFIRAERQAFAIIILANALLYFLLKHSSAINKHTRPPKKTTFLILLACLFLHINQVMPLEPMQSSFNTTWEGYIKQQEIFCKSLPVKSSFKSLFTTKYEDIFPAQMQVFLHSPFLLKFHEEYQGFAECKAQQLKIEPVNRIWSHKGQHQHFPENSAAAIKQAIKMGFAGVEIDLQFVYKTRQIVLAHNSMPEAKLQNKQSLGEFFNELGKDLFHLKFIWLDFKNLANANLDSSVKQLNDLCQTYNFKDKLLIETVDPFLCRKLSNNGFKTIFAIAYGNKEFRITKDMASLYKALIVLSKCNMISLTYETFANSRLENGLDIFPKGLYTVNDVELLAILSQKKDVISILTDLEVEPQSILHD